MNHIRKAQKDNPDQKTEALQQSDDAGDAKEQDAGQAIHQLAVQVDHDFVGLRSINSLQVTNPVMC